MIDRLVAFALHKRVVVWMVCIFLAAYGYYSWTQLPLEAYPDIADVSSQVVTPAPGLAAEEVERQDARFEQRLVTVTSRLLGAADYRGSDDILIRLLREVCEQVAAARAHRLIPLRPAVGPWTICLAIALLGCQVRIAGEQLGERAVSCALGEVTG